jgi:hypothetical protein
MRRAAQEGQAATDCGGWRAQDTTGVTDPRHSVFSRANWAAAAIKPKTMRYNELLNENNALRRELSVAERGSSGVRPSFQKGASHAKPETLHRLSDGTRPEPAAAVRHPRLSALVQASIMDWLVLFRRAQR